MRYELYSIQCPACGAQNNPQLIECKGCGSRLSGRRLCANCQSENPPNAYVCIHCYRRLKEKPTTGWLNFQIPPVLGWAVVLGTFGIFIFKLFAGWIEWVETELDHRTQIERYMEFQRKQITAAREKNVDPPPADEP